MCIFNTQLRFVTKTFFLHCEISSCPLSKHIVARTRVQVPPVTILLENNGTQGEEHVGILRHLKVAHLLPHPGTASVLV